MPRTSTRYARLEGGFWDDPKIAAISLAAVGLYAKGLSYCAGRMTDGKIPKYIVSAFQVDSERNPDGIRAVSELTKVADGENHALWVEKKDHYLVVDYLDHNISKKEWETKKANDSERKRKNIKCADSERIPSGFRTESRRNLLSYPLSINSDPEGESEGDKNLPPPNLGNGKAETPNLDPPPSSSGLREVRAIQAEARLVEPERNDRDVLVENLNKTHKRVVGVLGSLNLLDYRTDKQALEVVKWAQAEGGDSWLMPATKAWASYVLDRQGAGKPADFRWFAEDPAKWLVKKQPGEPEYNDAAKKMDAFRKAKGLQCSE